MGKRIEHHQTVLTTTFRVVDEERSYPGPRAIQQVAVILSSAEFDVAIEQIRDFMEQYQKQLDGEENAERDSSH